MKRSPRLFVEDILGAMNKIERYTDGLIYDDFIEQEIVVDAVVRNLEIIGEAAKNIPIKLQEQFLLVPWKRMIGLRNIISHGYFGIDMSIIWEIITQNLPKTKPLLLEMQKKLD